MAKKQAAPAASFDEQLILFRFFLRELRIGGLGELSKKLGSSEYEGLNESGGTYFCEYLARACSLRGAAVSADRLRLYDENICRHTKVIGAKRGGIRWKYFQYLSLLFTEMYLDRYFSDRAAFCADLNAFLQEISAQAPGRIRFAPYTPDKMNKLAFMCATGSGKTLLMHVNILQFLHYFRRAQRQNSRLSINKVIVLAPNEGMSVQHLEELTLSSISAAMFEKDRSLTAQQTDVIVIDMNKLKEEGKVKTVSVDSFEQNNLVLVDEGHRGLSGNIWYDYRTRLSAEGFAFEYSATFRQALNANAKSGDEQALMEEYGKSILMDYSYRHFYEDGYGKDYRIYNLSGSGDEEHRRIYLTGCLLSFYQQMKLFEEKRGELLPFRIEKPLLVFVGNRVTAPVRKSSLSLAEKDLLTDVEAVLLFLDQFVRGRLAAVRRIRAVLEENTGLVDANGRDLFYQDFSALREFFGSTPDPGQVYADILRCVFNCSSSADEPRLHLDNLRQCGGEIGLKVGEMGSYFGVISIGDPSGLLKNCEARGIVTKSEEFVSDSLFREIGQPDSRIKVLIGSRKFTEGWNSWRVSTMGLINFAKGEGSQAIQLFGRGVRLKGYHGCLKRSRRLDDPAAAPPEHIEALETLTIFGIKAQYMEDFKKYLELEGAPVNESIREYTLPSRSRWEEVRDKGLYVIQVKDGANFRKQSRRLILDAPDEGFLRHLLRSPTVLDCRSRIQTIDSTFSWKIAVEREEHTLPRGSLALLDYDRIFEELEQHKAEKGYYNLCIVREKLRGILEAEGWYTLLIPQKQLEIDSVQKLEAATDYAALALKSYLDKFYRYEKERWEAPLLQYAPLTEDDRNFIGAYTVTYAPQQGADRTGDELEAFFTENADILKERGGMDAFEKEALRGQLALLDFRRHLYAPLLCLDSGCRNIQVTPVALNEDERKFVTLLHDYTESHAAGLAGKSLYLLRNRSRAGMGFFAAGNFYPDFILWILAGGTQYISFIDPKGLLRIRPDDPKIAFHRTIKELEAQLAPTAEGKRIVLNSFILSGTPAAQLRAWWSTPETDADKAYREARHVYTLDDPDCIASMIEKILA